MLKLINRTKNKADVNTMSPLTWTYIGDGVYELSIRTYLVQQTNVKPHKLHTEAIGYVKAHAQAEILKRLQIDLTEEEREFVRRGRNTQTHHIAKNASMQDYMNSTAFKALIGYLYLAGQEQRLEEILHNIVEMKTKIKENIDFYI